MRPGFHAIVSGWTLQRGISPLTERIEDAARWTKENGPLEPDEEATVKLMIEAQIARGGFDGMGDDDGPEFSRCEECGVRLRDPDEQEIGMCLTCANH